MARLLTRSEKRNQVIEQLRDPMTSSNTDATVARFCGVTPAYVAKLREQVEAEGTAFQKGTYHEVPLDQLRLDGGTQPRAHLDEAISREYRDDIKAGAIFPPIGVVYDGTDYWVWDGFHRVDAHKKAHRDTIQCEVRQGTRRDAVLLAAGANSGHGLRRSIDDKQRAVTHILSDAEWSMWSDQEIARRCGVGASMVGSMRKKIAPDSTNRRVGADGRVINTVNIGRSTTAPPADDEDEPDDISDDEPESPLSHTPAPPMRDPVIVNHRVSVTLNGDPDADYSRLLDQYPRGALARLGQLITADEEDDGEPISVKIGERHRELIERLRQGPAKPEDLLQIAMRYGARIWELNRSGYKIARRGGAYWLESEPVSA